MLKQFSVFQLAQLGRDLGIALVCFFFSVQSVIGFLIVARKEIQKRLFIRSERKSKKGIKR